MNEDVFPIQDGDFPASYVCLPEGIFLSWKSKRWNLGGGLKPFFSFSPLLFGK